VRSHRWLAVPLAGVASAPLGHLIAYQVRFGPEAAQAQSTGAHVYFPALAGSLSGALAAGLVASLLVVAAARVLVGQLGGVHSGDRRWPVFELLPALFTVQLGAFLVQEVVESTAVGAALEQLPELMLWGTLGQLPVALVVALALSWLSLRLRAAVLALRSPAPAIRPRPEAAVAQIAFVPVVHRLRSEALGAVVQRGPPLPPLLPRKVR
jgi:hypothetical protein